MLSVGSRVGCMYISMVIYLHVLVTCCKARESLRWTTHTPPGDARRLGGSESVGVEGANTQKGDRGKVKTREGNRRPRARHLQTN